MNQSIKASLQRILDIAVTTNQTDIASIVRGIFGQDYATPNTVSAGSGTTTLNLGIGNLFTVNLTANATLAFDSPQVGVYILILKQDATGSRTVTWPSSVVWPAGTAPTLTTTANYSDVITMIYNGSKFIATSTLNFNA